MKTDFEEYIKNRNLVNRIYNMIYFFDIIKENENEEVIKEFFEQSLKDIEYVELLAKYFEQKRKKYNRKVELRCNLLELVNDLDCLKQYLN